jgi:pimeloyl-ACP methyl ester carboxylesterase
MKTPFPPARRRRVLRLGLLARRLGAFRLALLVLIVVLLVVAAAGCGKRREAPAPPAPATQTVSAPDGVTIAYDVRGSGRPALVFIHGWCCNRLYWKNQVDVFAKDHEVVTLDLPGHGASGANRSTWSIAGLGADVQAVVERLDLTDVVLVGHSLGGPIALEAAHLLPGRAVAVIAIDTLQDVDFVYPKASVETMVQRFETDFTGTMAMAVRSMFPDTTDPALVEWVISTSDAANHAAAVAIMRSYEGFDMKAALSGAKVPVRCLNVEPTDLNGLRTAVDKNRKYADFDAIELKNVGHYPMLERPEEFNAKLKEVLAALPKR